MARVPNKGAPQFMSRALRPGGEGATPPKNKPLNLGKSSGKPPKFGEKMPGMAPPFKKRGR